MIVQVYVFYLEVQQAISSISSISICPCTGVTVCPVCMNSIVSLLDVSGPLFVESNLMMS